MAGQPGPLALYSEFRSGHFSAIEKISSDKMAVCCINKFVQNHPLHQNKYMIDLIEFYAVSAIFRPFNGENKYKRPPGYIAHLIIH